jgi:hypothetical protein
VAKDNATLGSKDLVALHIQLHQLSLRHQKHIAQLLVAAPLFVINVTVSLKLSLENLSSVQSLHFFDERMHPHTFWLRGPKKS